MKLLPIAAILGCWDLRWPQRIGARRPRTPCPPPANDNGAANLEQRAQLIAWHGDGE